MKFGTGAGRIVEENAVHLGQQMRHRCKGEL